MRALGMYEDRALAMARFIHVEVLGLPVEQFMDEVCDCDSWADDAMKIALTVKATTLVER